MSPLLPSYHRSVTSSRLSILSPILLSVHSSSFDLSYTVRPSLSASFNLFVLPSVLLFVLQSVCLFVLPSVLLSVLSPFDRASESWVLLRCTEEPCTEFHCKGGEYCIDTSGLLCNRLPRYCIAKSLRCNRVPNCGAYDHSDEDGCRYTRGSHRPTHLHVNAYEVSTWKTQRVVGPTLKGRYLEAQYQGTTGSWSCLKTLQTLTVADICP